jgi:hypothetical protein
MPKNDSDRRAEILGMPFGTACGKLRKSVMFHLLQKHGENVCFKCGGLIDGPDDLTIEHKKAWQSVGAAAFWDVNNIAFSHPRCNLRVGWVRREITGGNLWCSACKKSLPVERFHKESRQRTGYALICRQCSSAKRRRVRARGDCKYCGAKREARAFRATHNICMKCHYRRVAEAAARRAERLK